MMHSFSIAFDIVVPYSETPLTLSCNSQRNPKLHPLKWKVGLAGIIEPSINFLNDTGKFKQLTQDTPKLDDGLTEPLPLPF